MFWKHRIMLDTLRQFILKNLWEEQCAKIIAKYQKLGRKHKEAAFKIASLSSAICSQIISNYYKRCKDTYIYALRAWLNHRNASKTITLNRPFSERRKNFSATGRFSRGIYSKTKGGFTSKAKPLFEYMPTEKVFKRMILEAVKNK